MQQFRIETILETELETRLVEKVKQFLLELGKGFTYIGIFSKCS